MSGYSCIDFDITRSLFSFSFILALLHPLKCFRLRINYFQTAAPSSSSATTHGKISRHSKYTALRILLGEDTVSKAPKTLHKGTRTSFTITHSAVDHLHLGSR